MSYFIIVSFVIALIMISITLGYWFISFSKTGSTKYSFLSYFPFEINAFRRNSKDKYLNLGLMVLTLITLICPFVGFSINYQFASSYILLVAVTVGIAIFSLLLFTKLSNFKGHVICAVSFAAVEILIILLEFFYFTKIDGSYLNQSNEYLSYILIVFLILQLIFEFVLILNPKYKDRIKKVRIDADTFARPKFNYLACVEWGTFLNLILSYIPIILIIVL